MLFTAKHHFLGGSALLKMGGITIYTILLA